MTDSFVQRSLPGAPISVTFAFDVSGVANGVGTGILVLVTNGNSHFAIRAVGNTNGVQLYVDQKVDGGMVPGTNGISGVPRGTWHKMQLDFDATWTHVTIYVDDLEVVSKFVMADGLNQPPAACTLVVGSRAAEVGGSLVRIDDVSVHYK